MLANSRSKLERRRGVPMLRSHPGAEDPQVQDLAKWSPPQPSTFVCEGAKWSLGALVEIEVSADLLPSGGMGTSTGWWSRRRTSEFCAGLIWLVFGRAKGLPGCTPHQDVLLEVVPGSQLRLVSGCCLSKQRVILETGCYWVCYKEMAH